MFKVTQTIDITTLFKLLIKHVMYIHYNYSNNYVYQRILYSYLVYVIHQATYQSHPYLSSQVELWLLLPAYYSTAHDC